MKKLLFGLLLLLGVSAAAQNRVPARKKFAPHQLAVNINPLPLLNPDPRLMVGVERRVAPRWSVLADAGPVVTSTYLEGTKQTRGFELRPALRFYYDRDKAGYLQGQLQYRLVRYKMHDWLGKDCVNGVPTYEQLQNFTFQKQNLGAALVAGGIERLGKAWLLDVSVGLGITHRTQKVAGEDGCCYFPNSEFFGTPERADLWVPIVPIAVKLAYVVK